MPRSLDTAVLDSLTGDGHIAYFSMEVALDSAMPTYSGGLGVLAGDTIRAAADLSVPMVGVTLLYHKGYFQQSLTPKGEQHEEPVEWDVSKFLEPTGVYAETTIEGRTVRLTGRRYLVRGVTGGVVPVFFLDTDLEGNDPYDRRLTDSLYAGDERYRLAQEIVLGVGGVAFLAALGMAPKGGRGASRSPISRYHMNEGHAALLTVALASERCGGRELAKLADADHAWVKQHCIFTTHTPVPAGHDRFQETLVAEMLGGDVVSAMRVWGAVEGGSLNMTLLAMHFARYVNGVAKRHGEVSREMFKNHRQLADRSINAITNGVHAQSWVAQPMQELFDRCIQEWRRDSSYLRYIHDISAEEIQAAHKLSKAFLLSEVKLSTGVTLDEAVFTIGFARRAAEYKRADLLFYDLNRLEEIARSSGPVQVIYAGKAHPKDLGGKRLIANVHAAAAKLDPDLVRVVYVPNYDMRLGRLLTSGVDLWLNTPLKPLEASGTSGMKAAMNGVPSFSTLDGWWVEGCFEGVTGWEIEDDRFADPAKQPAGGSDIAAASIYRKLHTIILPLFYQDKPRWAVVMRNAVALNGSFFNTHRMVQQYLWFAYR